MKKLMLLITSMIYINANAATQDVDRFLATNPNSSQIKAMLNAHKFSCKDLISGYINRIKLYNLTVINNKAPLNQKIALNTNR